MQVTRDLLNRLADCYFALRLAGFTPDEAQRILVHETDYQFSLYREARERGWKPDDANALPLSESAHGAAD